MKYRIGLPEKGDLIVCRSGHLVGQCTRMVEPETVCDPKDFRWFQPVYNGKSMDCQCGEAYSLSLAGATMLCIAVEEPLT